MMEDGRWGRGLCYGRCMMEYGRWGRGQDVGGQMPEVRDQRSEVRGQIPEIRKQRTEKGDCLVWNNAIVIF